MQRLRVHSFIRLVFVRAISSLAIAVFLWALMASLSGCGVAGARVADTPKRLHHKPYSDSVTIPRGKITRKITSNGPIRLSKHPFKMPNKDCLCQAFDHDGGIHYITHALCCIDDRPF